MVVIKKSNSHPDLLVYASARGEEGRVIKANDDEESSLEDESTRHHHHHDVVKGVGVDKQQQVQQPYQQSAKATNLELSFIKLVLAKELSVHAMTDQDLQELRETHLDILAWISLEDLRLCHQALIQEQQQQAHDGKATQLEVSFIGSLLAEELELVDDSQLQTVKERHGDILDWISLEDLRLVKEQQQPPHATELELSFIGSLLAEELELVDDSQLQTLKEAHGDILDWISLDDLRLVKEQQQPHHATQLELSFIGSLLGEELKVSMEDDSLLERVKESHGDILSWISLEDLRACLPVE